MPNQYQCLLFCSMSSHKETRFLNKLRGEYKNTHEAREKRLTDHGWIPLSTSEELLISNLHGYFGVAYYKLDNVSKTAEIIIAHRGTCFDEKGNILADIAIAEGQGSEILKEAAFKYVTKLFEGRNFYDGSFLPTKKILIDDEFEITKITHTGFSLGGFIAGACAGLTQYSITEAITFDAPGIGNLVENTPEIASRIKNYVTKPNLVNTCNMYIGDVSEITMPFEPLQQTEGIDFKVNLSDLGFGHSTRLPSNHTFSDLEKWSKENDKKQQKQIWVNAAFSEINHTVRCHNLDTIITAIEKKGKWETRKVYKWPSADNEFIYGEEPDTLSSLTHFGCNDIGAIIFSTIAIGVQLAKQVGSSLAWQITQTYDENGRSIGVVGINHTRSNKIYYTEQEFLSSTLTSSSIDTSASVSTSTVSNSSSASPNLLHQFSSPSSLPHSPQLLSLAHSENIQPKLPSNFPKVLPTMEQNKPKKAALK